MKKLLAATFNERIRQPTTEEIQDREERMRITEDRLWGAESTIRHLTINDDGSLTTRGPTQLEKLTQEFEDTKRYVETPSLTAICLYDDGSRISLGADETLALKQQIELQSNFLVFSNVEGNEIDAMASVINNEAVKGYGFHGRNTFVYAKEPFGSGKDTCIAVLPYSEDAFLGILKSRGMDFNLENHGMNYATNVRPMDSNSKPFN